MGDPFSDPFSKELDFTQQRRDIHSMIAVGSSEKAIRVSIPTDGMPAEAVSAFLDWLRVEAAARRSHLTESDAWKLAEEIKSDWWSHNQSRFSKCRRTGLIPGRPRYVKSHDLPS